MTQAQHYLHNCVQTHLHDPEGALLSVVCRWLDEDTANLSQHLQQPLLALENVLAQVLTSPELLYELVRQVDCLWGELNNERPHFQRPNQPPHPDDIYTHASVAAELATLLGHVQAELANQANTQAS